MKRTLIWLIGSNACGKSTQAVNLCKTISGTEHKEYVISDKSKESDDYFEYTVYKSSGRLKVANLGRITDQQCSGTDTLSKKQHIINSYNKAIQDDCDIIIVDSIMATGQFIEFIKEHEIFVYLVLLDYDNPENNFQRLRERRARKQGLDPQDIVLDMKTKENVSGKIRGFKSLYNRMQNRVDFSLRIDATEKPNVILGEILSEWYKHI